MLAVVGQNEVVIDVVGSNLIVVMHDFIRPQRSANFISNDGAMLVNMPVGVGIGVVGVVDTNVALAVDDPTTFPGECIVPRVSFLKRGFTRRRTKATNADTGWADQESSSAFLANNLNLGVSRGVFTRMPSSTTSIRAKSFVGRFDAALQAVIHKSPFLLCQS